MVLLLQTQCLPLAWLARVIPNAQTTRMHGSDRLLPLHILEQGVEKTTGVRGDLLGDRIDIGHWNVSPTLGRVSRYVMDTEYATFSF